MGRKVYAVRWWAEEWQVCEAEVEKETPTEVVLVGGPGVFLGAFGHRRIHSPANLDSTPAAAVARKLVEERAVVAKMIAEVDQQHARIRRLAALGGRVMNSG